MSVSDVSSLFGFMGGLGMFLYGMSTMADGMQKTAGSRMSQFLGMLTNDRFTAVCLGALITAIIQSSGAITVMVVGFISAGALNLTQAAGVIVGANIGTTITAWIASPSQLGSAVEVMKPVFYAPLLTDIGAMMVLFSKEQKQHTISETLMGLGLLSVDLEFMSSSISPYTDAPIFAEAFQVPGGNPLLDMVIGALATALLQSSSASVGTLQTLAMSGVVTTNAAIYITLGQNIDSYVTAMLSSMGGSRMARRAAVMHLCFNIIGAILFGVLGLALFLLRPDVVVGNINAVEIFVFHTVFNLTNTVLLLPFAKQPVKLSGILVREKEESAEVMEDDEEAATLKHLGERILESPAFVVGTATLEVIHMGQITLENVNRAISAIIIGSLDEIESVYKVEKAISNTEKMLTEYLVKVDNLSLTEHQKLVVNDLFYSVSGTERVGDHAENLAESASYLAERKLASSDTGVEDLEVIGGTVLKSFEAIIGARNTGNMDVVHKVSQYEDKVDNLEGGLREKHIERLSPGKCNPSSRVIFLDIISNLERISDHTYNLAGHIKDEM